VIQNPWLIDVFSVAWHNSMYMKHEVVPGNPKQRPS